MSRNEYQENALRWLKTAEEDLRAAEALAAEKLFSHVCFQSQQCAEKAVKALWLHFGADPWGHSIQKLILEFPVKTKLRILNPLIESASRLDRYYIAARYPDGLPDLTPGANFFAADAHSALKDARAIMSACKNEITG